MSRGVAMNKLMFVMPKEGPVGEVQKRVQLSSVSAPIEWCVLALQTRTPFKRTPLSRSYIFFFFILGKKKTKHTMVPC